MNVLMKNLFDLGIIFFVRLLGAIASLILAYFVSKNMTSIEAGYFFTIFTIITVLGTLSTAGFTTAFVRFIGGAHANCDSALIKGIFSAGLKKGIIFSAICCITLILASEFISIKIYSDERFSWLLKIAALIIPLFVVYQLVGFAFQGLHKAKVATFSCHISVPLIFCITFLVSISLGYSLNSANHALLILFFSSLLTVIFSIFLWRCNFNESKIANISQTNELIKSARAIWAASVMTIIVQWGGQLIASAYITASELAILYVALRASLLITFILVAINLYAAPRFAASHAKGDFESIRGISLLCSRVIFVVATPSLILVLIYAEFFMSIFGNDYKEGANILRILVFGQYVNVMTGSVGFLLNMTGHEKDMRNVVLFSGPLAIILGIILVHYYGLTGAATSTAIAVACQNILALILVKKRLGFNTLNFFSKKL